MATNTAPASSSGLAGLTQSKGFWEAAFVVALLLLIFSHKITIEGMIGGSA